MPTKKISDNTGVARPCLSPDHDPPKHMVFESGVYEHTCSRCGHVQIFTVTRPIYTNHPDWQGGSPLKAWFSN